MRELLSKWSRKLAQNAAKRHRVCSFESVAWHDVKTALQTALLASFVERLSIHLSHWNQIMVSSSKYTTRRRVHATRNWKQFRRVNDSVIRNSSHMLASKLENRPENNFGLLIYEPLGFCHRKAGISIWMWSNFSGATFRTKSRWTI